MDNTARAALARQLDAAPRPPAPAEPTVTGPTTAQVLAARVTPADVGRAYRDAVHACSLTPRPAARLTVNLADAARRERAAACTAA